eukprot:Selendium_serpulae@DN6082_c1_g1_i2.p2
MMCPYMVWGGHPQASRSTDLQSGQGWLGNITKCHGVEKAVIRSHFVRNMFLLVGMIANDKTGSKLCKMMTRLINGLQASDGKQSMFGALWNLGAVLSAFTVGW